MLPFQSLEHIDEPRREARESPQLDLFDTRGRQLKGWTNKLIWGDNKLILSSLKSGALRRQIEDAGGLKLIYIDPPFDVGADFSMDIEIGGETFHKEPNLLEQIAYRDTWGRGADSFIAMIYERLILMRDLMAEDGSIYVHCDWRVNRFIRLRLDEVFGSDQFLNEIVWNDVATMPSKRHRHDTKFFSTSVTRSLTRTPRIRRRTITSASRIRATYPPDISDRRCNRQDDHGKYRWNAMATYSQERMQTSARRRMVRFLRTSEVSSIQAILRRESRAPSSRRLGRHRT